MIAVSLGNSRLGRLALDYLLEEGIEPSDLVAVVRSPDKAADLAQRSIVVRSGAYGDGDAMADALMGVNKLYMISGMAAPEERILQHRGVIEAACSAGVVHIVYTSFIDTADDSPFFAWTINRDTEACLGMSGARYTVLRNGMYSETDLDHVGEYVKAGRIANNIGDGRISYISLRDLALAAVRCLLDACHENMTYTLTGPEAVSQGELAALVSRWTGTELPYVALSDKEYRATLPEAWRDIVVPLYQSVRQGNAARVTDDFERIVGRAPFTLSETWEAHYRPA